MTNGDRVTLAMENGYTIYAPATWLASTRVRCAWILWERALHFPRLSAMLIARITPGLLNCLGMRVTIIMSGFTSDRTKLTRSRWRCRLGGHSILVSRPGPQSHAAASYQSTQRCILRTEPTRPLPECCVIPAATDSTPWADLAPWRKSGL